MKRSPSELAHVRPLVSDPAHEVVLLPLTSRLRQLERVYRIPERTVVTYLCSLPRNPGRQRPGLASQHRRSCSGFNHPCSVSITLNYVNLAYCFNALLANLSHLINITFEFALHFLDSLRPSLKFEIDEEA